LSANAMHVLIHLGLDRAIAQIGVRPKAYVFELHDTGEEIQRFAAVRLSHRVVRFQEIEDRVELRGCA